MKYLTGIIDIRDGEEVTLLNTLYIRWRDPDTEEAQLYVSILLFGRFHTLIYIPPLSELE